MVGTCIGDRLFIALAKRAGYSKAVIRSYRTLQLASLEEGVPITLFTISRTRGLLDEQRAAQFLQWARQVVAVRPHYSADLIELDPGSPAQNWAISGSISGEEVVEVECEWIPDETTHAVVAPVDHTDELLALIDDTKPVDHTDELLDLLDEVESGQQPAIPSGRVRRFGVSDLLPSLNGPFDHDEDEDEPLDEDLEILDDDPDLAEDSALFSVQSWSDSGSVDDLFGPNNDPSTNVASTVDALVNAILHAQPMQSQSSAFAQSGDLYQTLATVEVVDPWA